MAHEIVETNEGLSLEVNGSQQALIRERSGNLDLIWCVRGPQSLDTARDVVYGLMDLLVHYDSMSHKLNKKN